MPEDANNRFFDGARRLRFNRICKGVVALGCLGVAGFFAFAHIFGTFSPWDDDGYFLQAFHDFLSGHKLYDQVYAFYGPFTFLSAALIARFNLSNVNEDTFRWAWLFVWILIALAIAGAVWRWTDQFSVAVVVFLLISFQLRELVKSVGHPQLWVIFAVACLLLLGLDWIYLPNKWMHAFCAGFLIGIVLLCKINIGIYVSITIVLTVNLLLKGRLRLWASGLAMIAAASFGLLLLVTPSSGTEMRSSSLEMGSSAPDVYFALAYLVSLSMIVGVAFFRSVEENPIKNLVWLVAGLGICLCGGVSVALASGTTMRGLFSLFGDSATLLKSYYVGFGDANQPGSIFLCICGIVVAFLTFFWRKHFTSHPEWLGILKVAVGTGLLCCFLYDLRLTLTGSLFFLWLLLIDGQPVSNTHYANRLFLALLGPLFSLQLFPIAGGQVDWASLMPTVAAAVILADGINSISHVSSGTQIWRRLQVTARLMGPGLAVLCFLFIGSRAEKDYIRWRDGHPVSLPGAVWLRLPPAEAARLMVTTSELRSNCRAVLSIPGMYSFSLWSGVPPIEEKRINSGSFMWQKEILQNELPKIRSQSQGCVLVSKYVYKFFKTLARSKGNDELLSEVSRTMKPIYVFQDLTIYQSSHGGTAHELSRFPSKPDWQGGQIAP